MLPSRARYTETFVLHTALSPVQVAEALRATMEDDGDDSLVASGSRRNWEVVGIVEGSRFRLYRRHMLFDDYTGDLLATMYPQSTGTRIEGGFVKGEYKLWSSLLLKRQSVGGAKFALGFTIVFMLAVVGASIFNPQVPLVNVPLVLISSFTLLAGLNLMQALWRKRRGREFLLNHVREVLNATIDA